MIKNKGELVQKDANPIVKKGIPEPASAPVVLYGCFLFTLVTGIFLVSLRNGFIIYDDPVYVTSNGHVQNGLTIECLKWAFQSFDGSNWNPMTWLSHMLDCQIFGQAAWGHHLTNVLLHATNAVLLFLLLTKMTGAMWRSLFVAALFGLHPLRVESVAWISERKDVLSTLFWMLTLWAYVGYATKFKVQSQHNSQQRVGTISGNTPKVRTIDASLKSKVIYTLALVSFACGLMSKPMVVTFPFALLLLDFWPLHRLKSETLSSLFLEKIPFFILAAATATLTYYIQHSRGAVKTLLVSQSFPVENALVSYCRYIGKLFYPINLAVIYPRPDHWSFLLVFFSVLILLITSAFVLVNRRRAPYLTVGWFWYLGTLLPVVGFIPFGEHSIADRYTYIPMIGLNIILAWGIYDLVRNWRFHKIALSSAAVVVIISCVTMTCRQIGYWENSETLFHHTIEITENNYAAYAILGSAYLEQGDAVRAMAPLQKCIQINPSYETAQLSLGNALLVQRNWDEASSHFQFVLKSNPHSAEAHLGLGAALKSTGHSTEALKQFEEAVALAPDSFQAQANLGDSLAVEGKFSEAINHFEQALKIRPDSTDVSRELVAAREQLKSAQ